ncbi:MAG: hypothetical protein IPM71_09390 [Bacteroidota bacterium]|nr:MAG: hypothetical protein IPM71_09390 [Bacteroidota bacterium]
MKILLLPSALCLFFLQIVTCQAVAQIHYRIEADYSLKEKSSTGHENLMLGRVYFDKNYRQMVFDISFPEKEILIINDTASIYALSNRHEKHMLSTSLIDFSVLGLTLNGQLEYFGLRETPFQLIKVEKDEGLVISTWELADKRIESGVRKMMLSQKDNRLQGLISFNTNDQIIAKQFFSEYILVSGLEIPSKVIQISYLPGGGEFKKITTYTNIKVNNQQNESFYRYKQKAEN